MICKKCETELKKASIDHSNGTLNCVCPSCGCIEVIKLNEVKVNDPIAVLLASIDATVTAFLRSAPKGRIPEFLLTTTLGVAVTGSVERLERYGIVKVSSGVVQYLGTENLNIGGFGDEV